MKNRKVYRIVLLFFSLVACISLPAQTIHWIIFADTQSYDIGDEVKNSVSALTTQFIDRINDAIAPKGYYSPTPKVYRGSDFTEGNCNRAIQNLKCGNEDIIVFYYLGHGGRAEMNRVAEAEAYKNSHPWPDLQFDHNGGSQKEFLSLSSVHRKLKQKGARLTLTIGMCCNSTNSKYKKHGMSSQSRKYKLVGKKFAKKIGQKLFLKYKGDIMVASAKPGQESQGGTYNGRDVDSFTSALCSTLDRYANNDTGENVTWSSFLSEVATRCNKNAMAYNNKAQTPKILNHAVLSK